MADLLTGARLLLAAPVGVAFARPDWLPDLVLLLAVALAIATDVLDGKVARRRGTSSPRGQLFDHATDFLFVTSGLAGCALAGHVTWMLPPLIVLAFSQYVLDSYLLHRRKQLRVSVLGRWNGLLYFAPLVVIATSRLDPLMAVADHLVGAAAMLSWALVLSTALSIVDRALAPRG